MWATCIYLTVLEKWFPIQGERAHSYKNENSNPNHIKSFFFALVSSYISRANLSCVVATIFFSLAFLSSSVSMENLSRLVAASFTSLALLSSSVSMAILSCLLVTTFSSLSFFYDSFSSHRFNLLRVARHCFSWFSVSDYLFFSSFSFLVFLFALSFLCPILSLSFFVLQSLKFCLL